MRQIGLAGGSGGPPLRESGKFLFNDLVGAGEQGCWKVDANGPRGFEIGHKFEFCSTGGSAGFAPFAMRSTYFAASANIAVRNGHKAVRDNLFAQCADDGDVVLEGEFGEARA